MSRQAGWYWVKTDCLGREPRVEWDCLYWCTEDEGEAAWLCAAGVDFDDDVLEIGPRIPSPDEPWQCVPVEATRDMRDAVYKKTGSVQIMADAWAAWPDMLAAAPKPGGEG